MAQQYQSTVEELMLQQSSNCLGLLNLNWKHFAALGEEFMEDIDAIIARAMERGAKAATQDPVALGVRFDRERSRLIIDLAGDVEVTIPARILGFSPDADLSDVKIEGGGFDLYFPSIDEGAFVPDLIRSAIEHRLAA
jgi:hypothetical protein